MESRSAQLRRRHRRILGWSMGVAVVLHAGAFALFPAYRPPLPGAASDWLATRTEEPGDLRSIDVRFGPPTIHLEDGTLRQEPPERVLEARSVSIRNIVLPSMCAAHLAEGFGSIEGDVRLRVGPDGRVFDARTATSSGDPCADRVLVSVAASLRYLWLPDGEARAPVDLVQPMLAEPAS